MTFRSGIAPIIRSEISRPPQLVTNLDKHMYVLDSVAVHSMNTVHCTE